MFPFGGLLLFIPLAQRRIFSGFMQRKEWKQFGKIMRIMFLSFPENQEALQCSNCVECRFWGHPETGKLLVLWLL